MKAKGNMPTTSIILKSVILIALLAVTVSDDLWADQKSNVDKTLKQPYAYLFPEAMKKLTEHLQREGIEVNELREDIELDVEAYRIRVRGKRPTQSHRETRRFRVGTILMKANQKSADKLTGLLAPNS